MRVDAFATTSRATCVGKTLQKPDVGDASQASVDVVVAAIVVVACNGTVVAGVVVVERCWLKLVEVEV